SRLACFFFQAEDGIRYFHVTGVQTCALPILSGALSAVNEALDQRPALIHRDCYGEGWLVRLRPADWPGQRPRFPQGEAARTALEEQMRLDGFDPDDPTVQALKWK